MEYPLYLQAVNGSVQIKITGAFSGVRASSIGVTRLHFVADYLNDSAYTPSTVEAFVAVYDKQADEIHKLVHGVTISETQYGQAPTMSEADHHQMLTETRH